MIARHVKSGNPGQRYDADHNGVLDESELEELLGRA